MVDPMIYMSAASREEWEKSGEVEWDFRFGNKDSRHSSISRISGERAYIFLLK